MKAGWVDAMKEDTPVRNGHMYQMICLQPSGMVINVEGLIGYFSKKEITGLFNSVSNSCETMDCVNQEASASLSFPS
jgi:hypothetical protein